MVGSIITTLYFCSFSPRYFEFSLSYMARIFRCKIINYVSPSIIFHRYILDILIIIERITYFNSSFKFKNIFRYNPIFIMNSSLIFIFAISLPTYFQFRIRNDSEFNLTLYENSDKLKNFEYCDKEKFSETLLAKALYLALFLFRDLFTLLAELIISYKSFQLYKAYLENKSNILRRNTAVLNSTDVSNRQNTTININLTKMTLIFSLVSTVCHTIVFASSSVLLFYRNQSYLLLGTVFIVLLKNSSNILLFYFFNKNFKKSIHVVASSILAYLK